MMFDRAEMLANATHHMVMATMSCDLSYLADEIGDLYDWFDVKTATADEIEMLMEVSLQASMDGRVKCLEVLCMNGMPVDEMCPIIAACHGMKDVILFCEKNAIGNCQEAWTRYFDWMICHGASQATGADEPEDLTLATEWISNYKSSTRVVANA